MSPIGAGAAVASILIILSARCSAPPESPFTRNVDAGELLARDPDLPATILTSPQYGEARPMPVTWRINYRLRRGMPDQFSVLCDEGIEEVGRGWTATRRRVPSSAIWQSMCGFPNEELATEHWKGGRPLLDALPEKDFANIDPSVRDDVPDRRIRPTAWVPSLVKADGAKLVCLDGNADDECYDWAYFARYGRYFVLSMARVGLRYEQFLTFVRSLDEEIAQRLLPARRR